MTAQFSFWIQIDVWTFCWPLQLAFISSLVSANLLCREGHVNIVNKRTTSWNVSSHICVAGTGPLYCESRCRLMSFSRVRGLRTGNITFVIPEQDPQSLIPRQTLVAIRQRPRLSLRDPSLRPPLRNTLCDQMHRSSQGQPGLGTGCCEKELMGPEVKSDWLT